MTFTFATGISWLTWLPQAPYMPRDQCLNIPLFTQYYWAQLGFNTHLCNGHPHS